MTDSTYREWRKELAAIIDDVEIFDKAFMNNLIQIVPKISDEEFVEVRNEYETDRQKMVDKLEAHCAKMPEPEM